MWHGNEQVSYERSVCSNRDESLLFRFFESAFSCFEVNMIIWYREWLKYWKFNIAFNHITYIVIWQMTIYYVGIKLFPQRYVMFWVVLMLLWLLLWLYGKLIDCIIENSINLSINLPMLSFCKWQNWYFWIETSIREYFGTWNINIINIYRKFNDKPDQHAHFEWYGGVILLLRLVVS